MYSGCPHNFGVAHSGLVFVLGSITRFAGRKRWVDFWSDGNAIGYHIRERLENYRPTSLPLNHRGVWDEAGSVENIQQALSLLRFWVIDVKEVDELPDRNVHRSML